MFPDIASVPPQPGVYLFKNIRQKILYVGKAKSLRNRIRSYLRDAAGLDTRKTAMMREVRDLSYVVTQNELEALVLEANLIKQYKPKYNIILRDDKNYPYLKLTVNEEWPRLEVVRKIQKDGALYFGPYVPAGSMWETLAFIRRNFLIRDCKYPLDKPMRPCIQYQMGKCLAPCAGHISKQDYLKLIHEIKLFLAGRRKDLIDSLKKRMLYLSEEMRYEEAGGIRDRIAAIEKAWESQKAVAPELGDVDVLGLYRTGNEVSVKIFFIRNGSMIGSRDFFIRNIHDVTDREILQTFILQFYGRQLIPPPEVITTVLPEDTRSLEAWLSQRRGGVVKIGSPKKGKKKELADMASENAVFACRARKDMKTDELLKDVRDRFSLKKIPEDIGAFDVSAISGREAVGAFVYWAEGEFVKDRYRKLTIRTVRGADDYSMMNEIIGRIIENLEGNLPDLVLIDGGRGHLEIARKAIEKRIGTLQKIPDIIAVAKQPDRAYLPSANDPVHLEDSRQSSNLLRSIRDEVHRFAIGYHRKLREKKLMQSPLERIHGIGKKRRFALLKVFGSIENIKEASIEEIGKVKGFHRKIAERLLHELRRTA